MLPDYRRDHRAPTFKPARSDLSILRKCSQLTRAKQIKRCYKIQDEAARQGVLYGSWLGNILHLFLLRSRSEMARFGVALLLVTYSEQRETGQTTRRKAQHKDDLEHETLTLGTARRCQDGQQLHTTVEATRRVRRPGFIVGIISTRGERILNERRHLQEWNDRMWQWVQQPTPMEGVIYYCDDAVGVAIYTATEPLLYQT